MKVAELKLVVDANAVEMRQEFANVREEMHSEFVSVRAEIADVRTEMRDGFAAVIQKMDANQAELNRRFDFMFGHLLDEAAPMIQHEVGKQLAGVEDRIFEAVDKRVDDRVDRKLVAFEKRLSRKRAQR
ncbi:MAG TPA: hypothetical protein VJ901_05990 [Thermoanaerobaculia bacterium]|jgi:hypothetical protein|nr:hypothetical protein [Thermoanaerobaculia bacterium]